LWFLLAAVSAQGQTYITTVNANAQPQAAAANLVTDKVYVANNLTDSSSGSITVINGATNSFVNIVDPSASRPIAVAVNSLTNKIYVANTNSNNVTVIDGSTDTIKTTVTVGTSPVALAVNPLTNKIYVANQNDGTVSVIDGSTDTVTATDTVGSTPGALAVNPVTNLIYVANFYSTGTNNISVINGVSNAVTQVSDAKGTDPIAVAVNPVTNTAYVANAGSAYVSVIRGTALTADVSVSYTQSNLAVNPVTNQIYVTCGLNNAIYIINGSTNGTSFIQPDYSNDWTAVAVDPLNNTIYAANNYNNTVTVVSGATNTITATLSDPNASNPYAVAINPVTDRIYVANFNSSNLTVIDGASYATTSVDDPSASNTEAVVVNPVTNTAYVANSGSNNVSVITGATLLTDVSVGSDPVAEGGNPVTNTLYVANNASNSVSVISGATNTVIATVADPSAIAPDAVAVNPVTNTIYVANYGSNNVTVITGATNTFTDIADPTAGGPYAVAVNPVTNTIYVANYTSGTVSVFAGDTNTLIAALGVGTNPAALAVNTVTNMIYVANYGSNNVSVINGATNTVVATVTDTSASEPIAVAANPVTNMIYVANNGSTANSDFPSTVTVINGANNTPTSIADPLGSFPTAVAVNPATNKIYVANTGPTYCCIDDGESVIPVTVIDGATNALAYSPIPDATVTPTAVAVNSAAGNIYVAATESESAYGSTTVIAEQQVATIPITTTVTALANDQTGSLTPTFNFTAANTFTAAPIDNLLFQLDTWPGAWPVGTSLGSGSFTGTTSTLQPGLHILYAYSTEGEEGTSTNTGLETSPLIGNITAYPFLVAAPEASLSPSSLTFGSDGAGIPVDTTTPEQTVTLTNNGSVPLAVTAVALGGSVPGNYSETDNCVASSPIAAGNTCTINVTFTPTTTGTVSATLLVTDNSGDVPGTQHQVSLTGTAVQATSATTVTPSITSSVFGESVTFTATVTPNTPLAPTGAVTFKDGTTTLCSAVTLTSGQATCATAALAIATHSIAASYTGDTKFTASSNAAAPLSFIVGKASSSVGVGSSVNPSVPGQSVTFTATVTVAAPGAGTPTGSVTFNEGATAICTSVTLPTSGQATCATSALAVGQHSITAVYSGDSHFLGDTSPSYSQTVNLDPTTTKITANTPNPSVVGQPVLVSFTVAVSPPGTGTITTTDTVTVKDITGASCTATLAAGSCILAPKTVGADTLTATFNGDASFAASSSAGTAQTVNPAATTTTITGTTPSSPMLGQPLTVNYTVVVNAPGGGTIPGTDTVTVTDSTGASCTGTVAAGSCALTPKSVGADSLSAKFGGDANYAKSTGTVTASLAIVQSSFNLTGLAATTTPDQPTSVGVALGSPATADLNGTLTLTFTSKAADTSAGYIDPMTCFIDASNQCVTQLNFTIPAGTNTATLPNSGTVQQGTTAGTIIVTLTALTAGGTSVLPQPAPSLSVVVPTLPPVIKSVSIVNETSTGFSVQVTAYSTPRDLANATFVFTAASGTDLDGTSPPAVALGPTAQPYFASANGALGGGTFVLTVPFTYSGDTSALGSVAVTLSNSMGLSSPLTGQ
jgi:YVTN family beta-propeller protein